MAANAARLARLFTPTYAACINARIVWPSVSTVVKPNELESALLRPMQVSRYEPEKSASYLAATLSYGIIKGHPVLDGNKRTAFFLANEYLRAQGLRGLAEGGGDEELRLLVERHVKVAKGKLDVEGFYKESSYRPLQPNTTK